MSAAKLVDAAIVNRKITVFSKSYCPYCAATKKKIAEAGVPEDQLVVYELDQREDGAAIQEYLRTKTNQGTVPNIFIGTKHIGGNSDFQKLDNKKVLELIAQ